MKRRKANQKSVVTLYTTVQKFGVGKKILFLKKLILLFGKDVFSFDSEDLHSWKIFLF